MAWRSSGSSNAALVANLVANRMITDDRVAAAFRAVDRAHYAPRRPYDDAPQSIGHGVTISAPHMHALAIQYLEPYLFGDKTVLDVGSGSGYLTALLAELVDGRVVGIEHIPALVAAARHNMAKSARGRALLDSGRVQFVAGDGRLPLPGGSFIDTPTFDCIHVGAAASTVHPALLAQLKAPGRIFIPLEPQVADGDDADQGQSVWTVDKAADGTVIKNRLFGVRYVPLTDAPDAPGGGTD